MATRMDPEDRRDDDVIVKPRDRGGNAWGWIIGILVIIALIVAALLLIPILTEEDEGVGTTGEDLGITVGEITGDVNEFLGETVIVSGEVDEVVAPNAFTMGGDEGIFGGGEQLLIVSAEDIALPAGFVRGGEEDGDTLLENDIVQVRGTVVEFVTVDAEEELGVDLDDATFEDFEGEPALIATDVVVTPRFAEEEDGLVGDEDGEAAVEVAPEINQLAPLNIGDPSDLAQNFEVLNGVVVRVNDEIDQVVTPTAFTFGEGDDAVLVISATPVDPLVEDSEVLVEGRAQTLVFAELEQDFAELGVETEEGIFQNDEFFDEAAFEEFETRPVLLATNMWVLTDVDDIADNPDEFAGLSPTVLAEVQEVLSPRVFTIADGDVLVVSAEPIEGVVEESSILATGVVTEFDIVEIEEETGLTEDELFADEAGVVGGAEADDEDAFNVDDAEGMPTIIVESATVYR